MNFAALQHSIFLQALGSAILNSLWQVCLLWIIYETVIVSYKAASAKFKHNLSAIILLLSFSWFVINFITTIFNAPGTSGAMAIETAPVHPFAIVSFWDYQAFLSYGAAALPYLSVAYIFLLLFLTARLVAAYRHVYFISNKQLVAPPFHLQSFASSVSAQLGIAKKISVWISHHVDVPATIGFLKPVVLIPFASINNLSAPQLEAIILHELSHIKRNDYLINLFISVIETTLFFNPFIVLLSNVIKRERENCCDDFVLQYQYDPHSYASALLRLEQWRQGKLQLAIGAVSGKKQLLSRIKRITNSGAASKQFNYGQKLLALLLVTFIIFSVAWLAPVDKRSRSNTSKKQTKEIVLINEKVLAKNGKPSNIKKDNPVKLALMEQREVHIKMDTTSAGKNNNLEEEIGNGWKQLANFLPLKAGKDSMVLQLIRNNFLNNADKKFKVPDMKTNNFPKDKMNFNMNFDIADFTNVNVNEGLKQAYKALSDLDVNEIKKSIDESFSSENVKNILIKNQAFLDLEKVKNLGKMAALRQQLAPQQLLMAKMQQTFAVRDLFSREQAVRQKNFEIKLDKKIKRIRMPQEHARSTQNIFYIGNETASSVIINIDKDEDLPGLNTDGLPKNKNLKISIRRVHGNSTAPTEKKVMRFSFNNDDEHSTNAEHMTVEVTN